MSIIVCKFGGSSVASPEKMRQIVKILQADPRRRESARFQVELKVRRQDGERGEEHEIVREENSGVAAVDPSSITTINSAGGYHWKLSEGTTGTDMSCGMK